MICNLTSDLGKYLVDGQNGFVVAECSSHSLQRQLIRAIGQSTSRRISMCVEAHETAYKCFSYKAYTAELDALING